MVWEKRWFQYAILLFLAFIWGSSFILMKIGLKSFSSPQAGVNPTLTMQVMKAIKKLQQREHKSVFIIEHSMKVISSICDKVFVLNFGKKMAEGTPAEIQKNEKVLEAYLGGP